VSDIDQVLEKGGALGLARAIRTRELSVTELVSHYLDVVRRENPAVNAFVEVHALRARTRARLMDLQLSRGLVGRGGYPAFYGVPSALKDDSPLRMSFLRVGSRSLKYVVSPFDGMLAAACRASGLVFLGKLSTSEMTILPFVHTDIHPPTRNPHDLSRYAGGSSGGSGAAVGSGMLPIAPGSDGAGSIRIPAAFCGLVGFKASRGAMPHPYAKLDVSGLATTGPLARTVADAAQLLDVIAGDPIHHEMPKPGSYLAACGESVPRALRIKVCLRSQLTEINPEIEAAVRNVARQLSAMGHDVSEGPELDADVETFLPIMQRITASAPMLPFSGPYLQPVTRWMREEGKKHSPRSVLEKHRALSARILAQFQGADVWLTPTVATLAPKVHSFEGLSGEETLRAVIPIGAFTAPFNVTGQPAVSLPLGRSSCGVPIGVQLVGQLGADRALLALAADLERRGQEA
jgi:amidase